MFQTAVAIVLKQWPTPPRSDQPRLSEFAKYVETSTSDSVSIGWRIGALLASFSEIGQELSIVERAVVTPSLTMRVFSEQNRRRDTAPG